MRRLPRFRLGRVPLRWIAICAAVALALSAPALAPAGDRAGTPGGSEPSSAARTATPSPRPDEAPTEPDGIFKLDHLIFIVQENRSFDHYFGTYPGADGLTLRRGSP